MVLRMALQSTNLFEPGRFTLEADEGKLVCGSRRYTMMFCYPADAGQDYAIIERARGMRSRIVHDGEADWAEAITRPTSFGPPMRLRAFTKACCTSADE
jgi:Glucose-6-phosphate isomerase (GPI)